MEIRKLWIAVCFFPFFFGALVFSGLGMMAPKLSIAFIIFVSIGVAVGTAITILVMQISDLEDRIVKAESTINSLLHLLEEQGVIEMAETDDNLVEPQSFEHQ